MASPLSSFLGAQKDTLGIQQDRQALESGNIIKQQRQQALDSGARSSKLDGLKIMDKFVSHLETIPDAGTRLSTFQRFAPELEKLNIQVPKNLTIENFTPEGLAPLKSGLGQAIQQMTTGQRDLASQAAALEGAINPTTQKPFTQKEAMQQILLRDKGFVAKEGTKTEAIKLAENPDLVEGVASSKAKIVSAVKEAESVAKARGASLTELGSMEAALPGVREVVGQLKVLADEATFSLGGKAFDAFAKQFGYSTEGDTARSKMVSIVDNQVLPLLRPIFGAAFTAAEGDRLRNAFLDPDSTPESRKAQLDSFLDQMVRNIEAKRGEVQPAQAASPGQDNSDLVAQAEAAIAAGAPREAVMARLKQLQGGQ